MATYKVWLTVKDRYGSTKRIDGGSINISQDKLTAAAPAFTGDKIGATFSGSNVAITASFAGTEGDVKVDGSYDKATSAASSFEGTAATITPKLVVGNKTVTVQ